MTVCLAALSFNCSPCAFDGLVGLVGLCQVCHLGMIRLGLCQVSSLGMIRLSYCQEYRLGHCQESRLGHCQKFLSNDLGMHPSQRPLSEMFHLGAGQSLPRHALPTLLSGILCL